MIRQRSAKGFTLVEVLVVVVILAILAAIAIPIYLNYVESARASEAQEAIGSIKAAAQIFQSQNGSWPTNVSQLKLQLSQLVIDRWQFTIIAGGQGIQSIVATSRNKMPGGAGKVVTYDAVQGKWRGYGTD